MPARKKQKLIDASSLSRLAALWNEGATLSELGAHFGASSGLIEARLNEARAAGMITRPRSPGIQTVSEPRLREIAEQFNAGASYGDLARIHRKGKNWVSYQLNACRRLGIAVRQKECAAHAPVVISPPPPVPSNIVKRIVGGMPISMPRLRCLESSP